MLKILIADQRIAFAKDVCEQLSCRYEVMICHDGEKALMLCNCFQPDLLMLDMEMPKMDGLRIIRAIKSSGMNTQILAVTACTDSPYVIRQLVQLGVQYYLSKPCTVTAAVTSVFEMILSHDGQCWNVEEESDSLLLSLGIRMDLNGYSCLHEAILLREKDRAKQLTKEVYPEIAVKYGGNAKRVERAIRCVIRDAWQRRDDAVWKMYFKPGEDGELQCPTNGYFISRLSMCIQKRKIG